jgi:hypothetical protein
MHTASQMIDIMDLQNDMAVHTWSICTVDEKASEFWKGGTYITGVDVTRKPLKWMVEKWVVMT